MGSGPGVGCESDCQGIVDAVRHLAAASVVASDAASRARAHVIEEGVRVDDAAVRDPVAPNEVATAVDPAGHEGRVSLDAGDFRDRVRELLRRRRDGLEAHRDHLLAIHRHRAAGRSGAGAAPSAELRAGGGRRSESHAGAIVERRRTSAATIDTLRLRRDGPAACAGENDGHGVLGGRDGYERCPDLGFGLHRHRAPAGSAAGAAPPVESEAARGSRGEGDGRAFVERGRADLAAVDARWDGLDSAQAVHADAQSKLLDGPSAVDSSVRVRAGIDRRAAGRTGAGGDRSASDQESAKQHDSAHGSSRGVAMSAWPPAMKSLSES